MYNYTSTIFQGSVYYVERTSAVEYEGISCPQVREKIVVLATLRCFVNQDICEGRPIIREEDILHGIDLHNGKVSYND